MYIYENVGVYIYIYIYLHLMIYRCIFVYINIYTLLNFDSDTYRCNNVTDKVNKRIIQ